MRNANSGVRNANFSGFNPAPLRGGGEGGEGKRGGLAAITRPFSGVFPASVGF